MTIARQPRPAGADLRGRRPRAGRDRPLGLRPAGEAGPLGARPGREGGAAAGDLRPALLHQPGGVADLLLGQPRDLRGDHRPLRRCSGSAFLAARIPREARRLEEEAGEGSPPLRRRQLLNVGVVMFVSQAVQVLIVSLTIGVFFAVFGLLAIDETPADRLDRRARQRAARLRPLRRAARGDRGAAARRRRARRLLRLLLRDRDAHRLDLPRGVPRGADLGDAPELPRARAEYLRLWGEGQAVRRVQPPPGPDPGYSRVSSLPGRP